MKSGKAVGPDDIPVEVWKCLGEAAVEFLTSLFNRVLESEKMPEEWRRSVLVPIFKNKGDVQSCSNYRGIKLMSHTMKLWEKVVEARLRKVVEICEQQYGFMPRKSTTDAIFALRILMEKYRDGQRELHCVFVDLEKVYDRVPREELWYCMRKSGVAEKYVRVVQDMYERSRTVVRCSVGQTEEFKVEVGLHQGLALSPFLFAIVMDQLSEEVRQESPWTMMFADDIVICSESREQVEVCAGEKRNESQSYMWTLPREAQTRWILFIQTFPARIVRSPAPHLGYSDHISVMLIPAYRPLVRRSKRVLKQVKTWPAGAISALQDCFECIDWNIFREAATNGDSINLEEYTKSVTSYIGKCIDDMTVYKTITTRSNQKLWMTAEVHALLKSRDTAFRAEDKVTLRTARAKLSQDGGDSQRMWQGIQAITNYKTTPSACDSDASLPDALNDFYVWFEAQNHIAVRKTIPPPNDQVLSMADVRRTLCRVNPRKSAGPDNIPGRVLREYAEQLTDVFTDIFNISKQRRCSYMPQDNNHRPRAEELYSFLPQ
ncbi:hypothetical protein QTP70_007003 [Hemibagrus guttatus]|uniref:ribonuclease H n=1 Tax=Hemibagrus guttatus TaxID=175788 RepID=A0AAE0QZS6_9TELE|nr:hypothetical protein QTP70_007003 [Hemibagrus guttatus]